MVSVLYASYYGSTKQYADALAARFGVNVQEIGDNSASLIDGSSADPVVILSPIHGPTHPGVKLIKQLPDAVVKSRPIALATVGMTLEHVAYDQDPAGKLLGDRAGYIARFYLPGRLNYSELSRKHRGMMKSVVWGLKITGAKGENEKMMIDTFGQDVDRVDFNKLAPVAEWVGNNT